MRRSAVPGATGHTEAPAPHRVEQKPQGEPRSRGGNRGRKARTERRQLETAVADRRDIRNERNPLARRHLGEAAHIDPDLLPARDFTRALRVEAVTLDVDHAYRLKRGEGL